MIRSAPFDILVHLLLKISLFFLQQHLTSFLLLILPIFFNLTVLIVMLILDCGKMGFKVFVAAFERVMAAGFAEQPFTLLQRRLDFVTIIMDGGF